MDTPSGHRRGLHLGALCGDGCEPPPTRLRLLDERHVTMGTASREFTSDEESSASMLKIGRVSRGAAGLYTCWANNSIEPGAMFKNFLLEVLCKISLDEELLKASYLNCLTFSYVIISFFVSAIA